MATVTAETEPSPTAAYAETSQGQQDHHHQQQQQQQQQQQLLHQQADQNITSKFGTDDKWVSKCRLRLVIAIVLGVSVLFQTIAIFSPGWTVVSVEQGENILGLKSISTQTGIYYSIACVEYDEGEEMVKGEEQAGESKCTTTSHLDTYHKARVDASDVSKITLKKEYNMHAGRLQIGVSIAWVLTMFAIVGIIFSIIKRRKLLSFGFFLGCTLSVCGVIMGEIVYVGLVQITYTNEVKDITKGMELGFPYSVFFYILALIEVLASCVILFKCFNDDVSEYRLRLSAQNVVLEREKKHVEYLNDKIHRRSPRMHDKYLRPSPRPSPRHSARSSREISPSPRGSPRPGSREHPTFFPPSPRESREVRDSDRRSPRPHDRHSDRSNDHDRRDRRPRDHDRHDRIPRDHDRHDYRPRDNDRHDYRPREHRSRDSGDREHLRYHDDRPRSYRDKRSPDERRTDRPNDDRRDDRQRASRRRDHHEGSSDNSNDARNRESGETNERIHVDSSRDDDKDQKENEEGDHYRFPKEGRGEYHAVAVNSDSEIQADTITETNRVLDKSKNEGGKQEDGESDVKEDLNAITIDV